MQHGFTSVHSLHRLAVATTLVAAAACSGDATSVPAGSARLGFVATTGTTASSSVVPVTVGAHTLDLATVSLTVARAELKRSTNAACMDDEDDDDDHSGASGSREACGELKIGPTTIELPVAGNVVTVPANTIPAGSYRELELRVTQVELEGTYDGKPFDVTLPVRVKREIEFSTPLVVTDGSPASITVAIPVQTWLVNTDGSLIDPTTIAASPTLTAQIANRISASLRAFEDRDHDGHEDHDRHGDRD
jgi:hypothetical protein